VGPGGSLQGVTSLSGSEKVERHRARELALIPDDVFEAERRLGELLAPSKYQPGILRDAGVTANESSRAQQVAAVPNEVFEDFRAMAISLERASRAFRLGDDAVTHAKGLRLWAERRMGELLAETPKAKNQWQENAPTNVVGANPPTLAELGITYNESKRAPGLGFSPVTSA
jgi:hypothetical protein